MDTSIVPELEIDKDNTQSTTIGDTYSVSYEEFHRG